MIRRPPRSTHCISSAASDVYKRQGVLQRVDADRRHHRARGSRGKTLPHFTVGDYVLGKHRKLMSTWTGPWRVAIDDKEHVYAVPHLVTAEPVTSTWRGCGLTPMTSSKSASSSRFSNNWRTRASTTSGASRRSIRLPAATSSLSRWPGKDWRSRRAPGSLCRACSMMRRPCCTKSARRCG